MADNPTNGRIGMGWTALASLASAIIAGVLVWQVASGDFSRHEAKPWHDNAGLEIRSLESRVAGLEAAQARGGRWTAQMQRQYQETMDQRLGRLEDRISYVMRACGVPDGKP